jgi:HAD superfamily phosphoserine phosphatase-like hydrolase
MSSSSRYATVILDVDSTVASIEGIDWLAALRPPDVAVKIAAGTAQAMEGAVPLEAVYGERLRLVAPRRDEIEALGTAYVAAIAPGARETVAALRRADVRVLLFSGGLRESILPVADALGIPRDDVHAVSIRFNSDGSYADFDRMSPFATNTGKPETVRRLAPARRILAVGDGATDAKMKPVVDTFAAFTQFTRREAVVKAADIELRSFAELERFVIPADEP